MTNNDVLRRLRYTFDWPNAKVVEIFSLGETVVELPQVLAWLKRDDDDEYKSLPDLTFSQFLNGLVVSLRGKKDDAPLPVDSALTNNIIFRKLKIAFNLTSDDVIALLESADFRLGNSELSAFFRKPGHKHYRPCKDQVLRNFLAGLQVKHRPSDNKLETSEK